MLSTKTTQTLMIDDTKWNMNITKTLNFFSYPPVNEPTKPQTDIPIKGPTTITTTYVLNLVTLLSIWS